VGAAVGSKPKPGARADVDEHGVAPRMACGRPAQRRRDLRAAAHLVHLVAVPGEQGGELVSVPEEDAPVGGGEASLARRRARPGGWGGGGRGRGGGGGGGGGGGSRGRDGATKRSAGWRSGGTAAARPSRSSSSASAVKTAAVSRQEAGEPGVDQASATARASAA